MMGENRWRSIDTAPRDPKTAIQMGFWNGRANRWTWLTHGAWDGRRQEWRTDERIFPTHWRPIGRP